MTRSWRMISTLCRVSSEFRLAVVLSTIYRVMAMPAKKSRNSARKDMMIFFLHSVIRWSAGFTPASRAICSILVKVRRDRLDEPQGPELPEYLLAPGCFFHMQKDRGQLLPQVPVQFTPHTEGDLRYLGDSAEDRAAPGLSTGHLLTSFLNMVSLAAPISALPVQHRENAGGMTAGKIVPAEKTNWCP